jgi:hypothetical protein
MQPVTITNINFLTPFKEIIPIYTENNTENRTTVDWNQLPAAAFEGSPLNLWRFKMNLRKV